MLQQRQHKAPSFSTTRLLIGVVVLFNVLVLYSNVRSFYEDDGRGDRGGARAAVTPHVGATGGSRQEGKFFHGAPSGGSVISSEFAAARQRALQDKQHRALPVLASLVTSESDLRLARRLVGSVHHWHLGLNVHLYVSHDVPEEQLSEARAWQDVAVVLPDALSKDLEPNLPPQAAAALLGGHNSLPSEPMPLEGDPWTPWRLAAMLHAAKSSPSGSAMYLEPWAVITGWLDHLFKELQRDGTLHICNSGPSGPRGYVSGVSIKAAAAMEQLQRQVGCLLQQQQQQQGEGEEEPHCSHMQPPGPEVRCHRPETVLVEMGSRPRGGGRGDDISDPDSLGAPSSALEGASGGAGEEEEGEESRGRRDREMAKYACLVRLRHLGSGLQAELRAEAKTPGGAQPGQRHIALGVPCSMGKQNQQQRNQEQHMAAPPVIGSLLPSVLATARQQGGRFRYTILVGFEEGDAALDDPPQLQELRRSAEQQLSSGDGRLSVALRAFRLPAAGSSAALWNALFDIAAQEGADYFMAAHQSTELPVAATEFGGGGGSQHPQLWSDALVQSLLENPMRRNFGVASPMVRGRPRSLTHPMVHIQTHRDVFGSMFPDALVLGGGPQGPEKWVSHVYGAHSTFLLTNVAVALPAERSIGAGASSSSPERACGADAAERAVEFAVEDSSARMREWLEANGGAEEL